MPSTNPPESGRPGHFPPHLDGPTGRLEIAVQVGSAHRTDSEKPPEPRVAVVAHPHPLYGGTMDNAVVRRTADRLQHRGFDVVRFNFRGVGSSDGVHDGGDGEIGDLRAVLDWCAGRFGGGPMLLAGYSFGAATILRSEPRTDLQGILLIAPPLSFYDLSRAPMASSFRDGDGSEGTPLAVICGSDDALTASPHRAQMDDWQARTIEVLQDVGHDLGAAATARQRTDFDSAVDRCLDRLESDPSTTTRSGR